MIPACPGGVSVNLILAALTVTAELNRSAEGEPQIFNLQSSIFISGLSGLGIRENNFEHN